MDIYVADAESFYDTKQKFGLRSCTTEEYINDPRFHCFGFSIKKNDEPSFWVPDTQLVEAFADLELHKHAVIAHNAPFDMAILNWKYGVKPKFIIDTLSMARALLGTEERLSLAALAERFGLGVKGDTVLHMDGIRHPDAYMARKLGEYACNDADLEWELWKILKPHFPADELKVIDMTVRMFTEPSFVLDPVPIEREILLGEQSKDRLLLAAGCGLGDLRSDPKFAQVLESLGVTPPMKLSAKKSAKAGEPVYAYAFAKSDADFKALAESEDDLVRWACEARLGLKSTIKASRSARFMGIYHRMRMMPIALDYGGAGTLRYAASSSAKVNAQNLPAARGSEDPDVALLRAALTALEGEFVVAADLSQIEARFVVWLAGQDNVVEAFAQGRDVYSEMASVIFGRHVDRKRKVDGVAVDFIPGFIGKAVILGCGYGLGHMKFAAMIYSGMLGMRGILFDEKMVADVKADVRGYAKFLAKKPELVEKLKELKPAKLSVGEWIQHTACAFKIINTFRERNAMIPRLWKTCDRLLNAMYIGDGRDIVFTDANENEILTLKTRKNAVLMPSGMWMYFKDLELSDEGDYTCMRRKEGRIKRVKVYGGMVLENLSQNMAGIVVRSGMVKMKDKYGHIPILQVHDEIIAISGERGPKQTLDEMIECMVDVPSWANGLPLAAEGGFGRSYRDAK